MTTVPALLDEPKQTPAVSGFEMKPRTLDEAMKFCEIMANSELVPKDYINKPGNIMVAIQLGSELGLTPMRSLRCISVVNGRASLWGDEMLAMVLAFPACEYVDESASNEKEGVCKVKRKGHPEHVARFTLEDAKRAGLLGKGGTWTQYTARMLKLRARGFALRDKFADALSGLITTEEALDIPADHPQAVPTEEKPTTLKDRLRAQVEVQPSEGAAPDTTGVSEPADHEAHDAPAGAPSTSDAEQCEQWKANLRTCQRNNQAINAVWKQVPPEYQQECYPVYSEQLKSLKK